MGMFSWLYADTNKQMIDGKYHDSYLLVPIEFEQEFGSHHIKEDCYDGYGIMGKYDIYDLVPYWNKKWIVENPDYITYSGNVIKDFDWYPIIVEAQNINNFKDFKKFFESKYADIISKKEYRFPELRTVGIDIACYDKDNEAIENPIKIVESDNLLFHQAYASKSDPNQGWEYEDEDYEE